MAVQRAEESAVVREQALASSGTDRAHTAAVAPAAVALDWELMSARRYAQPEESRFRRLLDAIRQDRAFLNREV